MANIVDAVALTQTPGSRAVREVISAAFRRNARWTRARCRWRRPQGLVVLSGTVSSWATHDEAVAIAWSVPGVVEVKDGIQVGSGA